MTNKSQAGPPAALVDSAQVRVGGRIYSTGTADVLVEVARSRTVRTVRIYNGRRVVTDEQIKKNDSAFADGIFLFSPGPERFIASNRQIGNVVNLGRLPAGEIILGIKTPERNTFRTGDPMRNPDQLAHAIVKAYRSGVIEVWFEDLPGGESDFDYNDAVIRLSGGVISDVRTNSAANTRTEDSPPQGGVDSP